MIKRHLKEALKTCHPRTLIAVSIFMLPILSDAARLGWPGATLEGIECYGIRGDLLFDYRGDSSAYKIVENRHFTSEVEQLSKGTSEYTRNTIDYTLRAIPNHHRALWAMARWDLLKIQELGEAAFNKLNQERKGRPPTECYFHRAKQFAPDDGMVPAIFGIYLHKRGKLHEALAEYLRAEAILFNYGELMYNIGLIYFDLGDFLKSQKYAEQATKLGYPLTGLHKKLDTVKP